MFEISVVPVWAIHVFWIIPVIVLIAMIIYFAKEKALRESGIWALIGLITVAVGLITLLALVLIMEILPSTVSVNNPHNIDEVKRVAAVTVENGNVNKFVAEQIEVDNVSAKFTEDSDSGYIDRLKDGEIVEFVAIAEDVQINGSFYFNEESMVIIINDENNVKSRIEVMTE